MRHRDSGGKKEAVTFVDAATGRSVLQLTTSDRRSVHGYYDLPPWSPVDGRIAFTRMDAPDAKTGEIFVMDADGGNLVQVATSRAMSPNDGAMAQWSADGRRVYFKDRDGQARLIAWADPDTGERGAFSGDLRMICPAGNRQVYHTVCSDYPDGEVARSKEEHGMFVQDLDTGSASRIATVADCWRIHPRKDEISDWHLFIKHTKWSPDGSRLMFVFTNEIRYDKKYSELPRVKDVYVINPDGSGLKRVGEFGHHPLWHPNGQEVLTNSPFEGSQGNRLVLTDVDSGRQRLAAACVPGSGHPSFSPDGRYIAVESVREGVGTIRLVDAAADAVEPLAQMVVTDHTHAGTHLHPVWSPDGKQLLYASDASGTAQLCVVEV